jgi:hypothetical protein
MAAMIVFCVFCLASIVFLISFFVVLWNDRKWSRYVLKVHRVVHAETPLSSAIELDGITSRSKVLSAPFRAQAR